MEFFFFFFYNYQIWAGNKGTSLDKMIRKLKSVFIIHHYTRYQQISYEFPVTIQKYSADKKN